MKYKEILTKKRILVTWWLWFIWSYFIQLALEKWYYVINIDKKTYASRKDLDFENNPNYELIEEDICEIQHLPVNVEYIINFAAESHVDNSITANKIFLDSNIYWVYNLLELIRSKWVDDRPKFVHISTDEVYWDIDNWTCDEKSRTKASNPYSATKAAAEQLVFAWGRTYSIEYIICRSSNNYGYWQYPEKLIPKTIEFLLQWKKMTVHWDGSYKREWTYAWDNVEWILLAMEKWTIWEIYNISSWEEYDNLTIVQKILKEFDKPNDFYTHVENRIWQDTRYSISSEKIKKLWWKSNMTIDKYLPIYINNYLKKWK